MGHIELAKPVLNVGYLNGVPSRIGILLDIEPSKIREVANCFNSIVTEPGSTELKYKQILNDKEYREVIEKYGEDAFRAEFGSVGIKEILSNINLEEELKQVTEKLKTASGHENLYLEEKRGLLKVLIENSARPEWMVFDVIPVIPPEFRPVTILHNNKLKISDISNNYRKIVRRNIRIKRLIEMKAPEIIIRSENKMLQKEVDALINEYRIKRRTNMTCSSMYNSMLCYEDNE